MYSKKEMKEKEISTLNLDVTSKSFKHVLGLPYGQHAVVSFYKNKDKMIILRVINYFFFSYLPIKEIISVQSETQQKSKSVVARGLVGSIFGIFGLLIGAISGVGNKITASNFSIEFIDVDGKTHNITVRGSKKNINKVLYYFNKLKMANK